METVKQFAKLEGKTSSDDSAKIHIIALFEIPPSILTTKYDI